VDAAAPARMIMSGTATNTLLPRQYVGWPRWWGNVCHGHRHRGVFEIWRHLDREFPERCACHLIVGQLYATHKHLRVKPLVGKASSFSVYSLATSASLDQSWWNAGSGRIDRQSDPPGNLREVQPDARPSKGIVTEPQCAAQTVCLDASTIPFW